MERGARRAVEHAREVVPGLFDPADVAATNGLLYVVDAVIKPGAAAVTGAPASATAPQAPDASAAPANSSQAPTSGAPAQKGK